jgi:hypothetical protein
LEERKEKKMDYPAVAGALFWLNILYAFFFGALLIRRNKVMWIFWPFVAGFTISNIAMNFFMKSWEFTLISTILPFIVGLSTKSFVYFLLALTASFAIVILKIHPAIVIPILVIGFIYWFFFRKKSDKKVAAVKTATV